MCKLLKLLSNTKDTLLYLILCKNISFKMFLELVNHFNSKTYITIL